MDMILLFDFFSGIVLSSANSDHSKLLNLVRKFFNFNFFIMITGSKSDIMEWR